MSIDKLLPKLIQVISDTEINTEEIDDQIWLDSDTWVDSEEW